MLQRRRNYTSLPELGRLREQMDRMFEDSLSRFFETSTDGAWRPAVDVIENDESIQVRAELPGLSHDDIDITIEDNQLTLRGEKQLEDVEEGGQYRRVESRYGTFIRSFPLPTSVDQESVDARFKDGVLRIELPKTEVAKPKRIEVKSA